MDNQSPLSNDERRLETKAIHAGVTPEPITGAVMTPVFLTSTYAQKGPGEHTGFEYSRTQNPTRFALQDNLAALEGGRFGAAFASGCAAATTILLTTMRSGDHLISSDDVYGGTYRLFDKVLQKVGMQFSFIDLTHPNHLEAAWKSNTRMLWIETPTNPLLKLVDIAACSRIAKARGALVVVDNTFMSPYFQRPLTLGADIVLHSLTKYLNGHSDAVGGALITNREELAKEIYFHQNSIGAILDPFSSFLVLRGIKTLAVRMKRHEENATQIAQWLARHPWVEKVIYPGLPSHPQHVLAKQQMSGFGGMISFVLRGDLEKARIFLKSVRLFTCAESLGGVESLIELPAIMTHASIEKPIREKLGLADGLIRVSVGLEHVDDLIADLQHGFSAAFGADKT